jgi:hypothetical protein
MDPLVGLLNMFLQIVKKEKLAMALYCPKGDALLIAKIRATEKAAGGVEAIIRGGDTTMLVEALDEMIVASDDIIAKLPPAMHVPCFEERAHILSLRERIKSLDAILKMPDVVYVGPPPNKLNMN